MGLYTIVVNPAEVYLPPEPEPEPIDPDDPDDPDDPEEEGEESFFEKYLIWVIISGTLLLIIIAILIICYFCRKQEKDPL